MTDQTESPAPIHLILWFMKQLKRIQIFVVSFTETSTIHGFVYLARHGLHIIERLLWTICICIAIFGTASLAQRTWTRFQTSPMVISMDRNKFFWNTSFPSLTICTHKRIDDEKLTNYIRDHPEKFYNETDKLDFDVFINKLANLTFENFEELPNKNTFGIASEDYLDLLYNLTWIFSPEISSGTDMKLKLEETMTELGLCYAVNSRVAIYNSYRYWKKNRWDIVKPNNTVYVHPLDGEIYAQIINLSSSYEVYFHGAMEVPDISKQRYSFLGTDYTTVELLALEILTSDNARDLTTSQRQCRFPHEADILQVSPIYSSNLCHMECRMRLSMKKCGCIPHFYRSRGKHGKKFPICDFDGLLCLVHIKDELISLKSTTIKIECNCLTNCDDSIFFIQASRSRRWFLGANLQWGINDYPKMQLKRDLIFGFTDLLVYIGGMAGFFLGSSVLSIMEILYFYTWRITKYLLFST